MFHRESVSTLEECIWLKGSTQHS